MTIINARALLERGCVLLAAEKEKNVSVDLASVKEVDSSALAVFFGLQRFALVRGTTLTLTNPSESLLSLAGLYGVDEWLPLV